MNCENLRIIFDRGATYVGHKRGTSDVPLVCREQEDVGAGRVHLVTLPRVNGLLLHSLDLERLQLLIEDLTLER